MRWAFGSLALLVFLAGCGPDERAPESTRAADSAAADTPVAEPPVADGTPVALDDPLAPLPDSLRIRRGVCPFECCVYREWRALAPVAVLASESAAADTLAVVPAGEVITGLTGNVHITSLQRVVVTRPVREMPDAQRGRLFAPGDTLFLLEYVGEGYYNVWSGGEIYQLQQFWTDEARWTPDGDADGYAVGTYDTEWWSRVRTSGGVEGWIDMERSRLGGMDACSI